MRAVLGLLLLVCGTRHAVAQSQADLTPVIKDAFFDLDASVNPGDVAEGCATNATGVDLLRFSAITRNVGTADVFLGDPQCPDCATNPGAVCGNPRFHCSPASGHDHPHYSDYALYELVDAGDNVVAAGGKRGFCVEDAPCPGGISPQYSCDYQGITAGCADEYIYSLGCQYIDVTHVAAGNYRLRVTADPFNEIVESNETNNVTTLPVTIGRPREPDEQMPGRRAVLTAAAVFDQASSTRFAFSARPDPVFDLPDPSHAPTSVGATLVVSDTGGGPASFVFQLPSGGWRGLGDPPGSKGYRYRGTRMEYDPDAFQARGCRSVHIARSGVSAACDVVAAPWTPVVGGLKIVLSTGDAGKRYCATFGGTDVQNDARVFTRKNAPPAGCGG